jgi:hypothetical protein
MAGRAKPTLRCLREDLGQAVPPADTPLDEVPHPLLAKASERFADDGTSRERIASVDHRVLFKATVVTPGTRLSTMLITCRSTDSGNLPR